ncbi:MAG: rhodanese-like domain-containing protein, partial [Nautilia sp.]
MKKLFFILFFISSLFSFEVVDATKSNIIALHNKNIPIIDIRTPYEWKAT